MLYQSSGTIVAKTFKERIDIFINNLEQLDPGFYLFLDTEDHDDGYALIDHFIRVLDGEEDPVISLELVKKHGYCFKVLPVCR